jgi:hypothetical protein
MPAAVGEAQEGTIFSCACYQNNSYSMMKKVASPFCQLKELLFFRFKINHINVYINAYFEIFGADVKRSISVKCVEQDCPKISLPVDLGFLENHFQDYFLDAFFMFLHI